MRSRYLVFLCASGCIAVAMLPRAACAQLPTPGDMLGGKGLPGTGGLNAVVETASMDVFLKDSTGKAFKGTAIVTLMKLDGQFYQQSTVTSGYVRFNNIAPTEYTVQVVAPAHEKGIQRAEAKGNSVLTVTVVMHPSAGMDAESALGFAAMKPKAQKELLKAMEALEANKPNVAGNHLEALNRISPNQPEVSYLMGVQASQLRDWEKAKSYWSQALSQNPRHARALLSLAEMAIREKKAAEAIGYAARAQDADSSSWRAHALLAEGYSLQEAPDKTIQEAERAMELSRGQPTGLEPVLAHALVRHGEKSRAIAILTAYVQKHPGEEGPKKQLAALNATDVSGTTELAGTPAEEKEDLGETVLATMGRSMWMPADIDSSTPPVESGAACSLEEVIEKAGVRMQELVQNVNRFTAKESVSHIAINKKGFGSPAETAKFDYLVNIESARPGFLTFDEYRQQTSATKGYPVSVMTDGLPGLVLVFHPYYAKNYAMRCEGLSKWNGQLAWQVHFQQRTDQPNVLRSYRVGMEGQSYPVALKGRAWIGVDTYQVVRMETDLVAPLPQIQLALDHIAVEYTPVHFQRGDVEMWLPQSAGVFYQWRGRRVHRRHSFSNYMLFSVEDKQQISAPRVPDTTDDSPKPEKPSA